MSRSSLWIVPLCLASFLWAISFGLNAPLASKWMSDAGYSNTWVGLNTGAYYLGIALAAGLVPWLMRRWGHTAVFVGMLASAVTAAVFPWGSSLLGWFLLRGLNGMAAALSLIPLETYVNHYAPPEQRATRFGYYAFCIALGMAMGTLVGMQMYDEAPRLAFVLCGLSALLGGVVVLFWRPVFAPQAEEKHEQTPLELVRNFLGFGSSWCQGFLEGGMVGLLPLYLAGVGLSNDAVGYLMGGLMVGVILAQVPVAWLADRLGRTAVLAGCHLVTLLGIGCLLVPGGTAWLAVWLFLVGACSGAFYPLGLALLGERTRAVGLARANAWYLGINCVGSLTGPVIAGYAMDQWGRNALFAVGGAAVYAVLIIWVVLEVRRRGKTRATLSPDEADDEVRAAA